MVPEDTPVAVWVNGRPEGVLSPLERGLHYGDGLFETIACVGGRPRFVDLHLARLRAGCARLGIDFPALGELRREILEVAAGAGRSIVKVVLTRGPAVARGYGTTGAEQPTRLTLRYGWEEEDPRLAADGVRVRTAALRLAENPALAGLKHLNRLEQVLARRESPATAFEEALMFSSGGRLISGIMSNVFVVESGALRTPLLDRCGVAGIMRQVVLREARGAGIVAVETELAGADLERAREIFLTSAVIGLRPVRELDGRACGPGAVTRELQRRLAPLLAEATDG